MPNIDSKGNVKFEPVVKSLNNFNKNNNHSLNNKTIYDSKDEIVNISRLTIPMKSF